MNLVTNGLLMVSASAFTLGSIHLILSLRRNSRVTHLLFAIAAFGITAYALVERAMMLSETPEEYGQIVRWGHISVWLIFVPLVLFVRSYLHTGRVWLLWSVIITRTCALILNFTSDVNLNYLDISGIKKVPFLGETVSIAVGVPNPLMLLAQASHFLAMIYFIDATISTWRQGNRRRALTIGTSVVIFAAATYAMSILVFWNHGPVPLFVSPFFLCMITAMGYELTRDVQRVAELADELNKSETKLSESTEQLNLSANAANVGIWTRHIPNNEFRASDKWFELFGFGATDDPTFDQVLERIHSMDRESVRSAVEKAVDEGVGYDIDFQITLPDDMTRRIQSRCNIGFDDGKPSLLRGADIDVTARKLAEESRRNLAAIVESSQDAIFSKTLDGVITSWNAGAEKTYGYNSDEILGRHVSILAPDEHKEEIIEILDNVSRGIGVEQLQTVRVTREGRQIDVSLSVSPIRDQHGTIVGSSSIARDISRRRQAEEALRQSETRFRTMADSAPVLIWLAGTDKLCTYFNKGWMDFTGRKMQQELGNGWAEGIYRDDLKNCMDIYNAAFDRREQFKMEYRLRRADGVFRWIHDIGTPRFASDGEFLGYIGSCIDINERKAAEEVMQDFTARLINAQEGERSRVARELHDDLSQSLALLSIQLNTLSQEAKDPADFKKQIGHLTTQIQKLSSDIHRISHELHPAKLEQLGLESALRGFCREIAESHGFKVDFDATSLSSSFSNDVSLCLYRVAQESLQNVVKHSNASRVSVNIKEEGDRICLTIIDNGRGFDPHVTRAKESLGFVSMNERLRAVGGTIEIHSTIGTGTQIVASVPFFAEDAMRVKSKTGQI